MLFRVGLSETQFGNRRGRTELNNAGSADDSFPFFCRLRWLTDC